VLLGMFAHDVPALGVLHGVYALGAVRRRRGRRPQAALPVGPAGVPASVGPATAI
jgi:hypothetical protein